MEEHVQVTDLASADEQPQSPLEQLAAKRKVLSETRETHIPVPGYDREPPLLLIRYRLLDGPEISRLGDKIRRETRDQWQRQVNAAIDTFIAACEGFYYDLGDGNLQPLTYHGEQIMRFDTDLAEALQFSEELPDEPTARAVAFALFNNNDARIAQHNYLLNAWFQDTSLDVQSEFLGNL